jgi:hypothetical protein
MQYAQGLYSVYSVVPDPALIDRPHNSQHQVVHLKSASLFRLVHFRQLQKEVMGLTDSILLSPIILGCSSNLPTATFRFWHAVQKISDDLEPCEVGQNNKKGQGSGIERSVNFPGFDGPIKFVSPKIRVPITTQLTVSNGVVGRLRKTQNHPGRRDAGQTPPNRMPLNLAALNCCPWGSTQNTWRCPQLDVCTHFQSLASRRGQVGQMCNLRIGTSQPWKPMQIH